MNESHKREFVLLAACAFLGIALTYVVMLNLYGIRLGGTPIDYARFGTWGQAISGAATSSALIVALASLYSQRSIHRSTEMRRLIEEETAVFQWLTFKEVRDSSDKLIGRLWDIKLQNSTSAPIYHWRVTIGANSDHLCNYLKRPLLPGENVFNAAFLDHLDPNRAPEPLLIFMGSSGRIWGRTAQGILSQLERAELDCLHAPKA
jgi:hypothetical protein